MGALWRATGAVVVGAVAGAVATVPMTAVMALGRREGLLGTPPPRVLTDEALEAVPVDPPEGARRLLTATSHVGFGAAAGVGLALAAAVVAPLRAGVLPGALYGLGVWAASYAGWVPAVGALPPPGRDRPGRPTTMVLAHLVYGAVLGWCLRRYLPGPPTRALR